MDGTALLQIAEGATNEVSEILQRMRELAIQAANDTLTSTERNYAHQEFDALRKEIDRISAVTNYNGMELISSSASRFGLSGASTNTSFWIDSNSTAGVDSITVTLETMTVSSLNSILTLQSLTTQSNAASAISYIDTAMDSVNSSRAKIGAYINRLNML